MKARGASHFIRSSLLRLRLNRGNPTAKTGVECVAGDVMDVPRRLIHRRTCPRASLSYCSLIPRDCTIMITTFKKTSFRHQLHNIEGWIDRVDLGQRRLYLRTGSRDRYGLCILIPEDCEIRHETHSLHLRSLLPCDVVSVGYQENEVGARIARHIEVNGN